MEYLLAIMAFGAAFIAAIGRTWDANKSGGLKFTSWGYGAVAIAAVVLISSIVVISNNNKEQKEQLANLKQVGESQKKNVGISEEIKGMQQELFLKSKELIDVQKQQLTLSNELATRSNELAVRQQEQLSLSSRLDESQKRQIQLSESLTAQQRKQIGQLERLSLDRNLLGVEVSFKPSTKQWSDIIEAYRQIEPPVTPAQSFPFGASTMIAKRGENFWTIDFTPIDRKEGSIRFDQVSTNKPETKAYEAVINKALVQLLIKWGNDLETEISPGRNYPSSIMVSQDKIALILRPPVLSLNLSELKDNPTIKYFRKKNYPDSIRFLSLDHNVIFDLNISPDWKKDGDKTFFGKMMPYISGPHPLNITFKNISP